MPRLTPEGRLDQRLTGIASAAERDVLGAFRGVDPADIVTVWPELSPRVRSAILDAQGASLSAVGDYLGQLVDGFVPVDAEPWLGRIGGQTVDQFLDVTPRAHAARLAGGMSDVEAAVATANRLATSAATEPFRIGREAVAVTSSRDHRFTGWKRVAEAGACSFCRMLATRGAVYTEDTVTRTFEGLKYHLHCKCRSVAAPAGSGATPWDGLGAPTGRPVGRPAGAKTIRRAVVPEQSRAPVRAVTPPAAAIEPDGGWKPGQWAEATADDIAAATSLPEHLAARVKMHDLLAGNFGSHARKAKPVFHRMSNGNKAVELEQKMPANQLQQLLSDFDEAIAAMPDSVRAQPVSLVTPVGDPQWRKNVGGYVIRGVHRIHLKPAIAKGSEKWPTSTFHQPASTVDRTRRDVLVHEMGHVVDDMTKSTGTSMGDATQSAEAFWRAAYAYEPAGTYGQRNAAEGFAEAFMQWNVGGPGSSVMADVYARRYGWS